MYEAPQVHSGHLDDLIADAGGERRVLALLDITPRTLRRWRRADYPVPQMALKLLWYASWRGRQAADIDLFNEVRLLRTLVNAVDRQTKAPVEADAFIKGLQDLAPAPAAPTDTPRGEDCPRTLVSSPSRTA